MMGDVGGLGRVLNVAAVAGLAAGCGSPPPLPPVAPSIVEPSAAVERPRVTTTRYACGETTYLIAFFADRLVLTVPGWEVTLRPEPAATGALYATRDIMFWHRGAEGVLELGSDIWPCRELPDPWRRAGDRGIDLRAIGQEPGWFAEIDEERAIRVVYDYAEREVTTGPPAKEVEDGRITYMADVGSQRVTVIVEEKACNDVMSGEAFLLEVTVTIDERTLDGCGRRVTSRSR